MQRSGKKKNKHSNQKGTTLVELLISIAILGMIVGTFLSAFVYATKTNIDTDELTDGTYVAQTCMEEVYALSISASVTNWDQMKSALIDLTHSYSTVNEINYTKQKEGFYVDVKITPDTYTNLYKVVVSSYYDAGCSELAAKMENRIVID